MGLAVITALIRECALVGERTKRGLTGANHSVTSYKSEGNKNKIRQKLEHIQVIEGVVIFADSHLQTTATCIKYLLYPERIKDTPEFPLWI